MPASPDCRHPVGVELVPSAKIELELDLTRPGDLPLKLAVRAVGIRGTSEVKYGLAVAVSAGD